MPRHGCSSCVTVTDAEATKRLKQQVTIRIDQNTVRYFKELSESTSIPYRTLINLYLRECAATKKRLHLEWAPRQKGAA